MLKRILLLLLAAFLCLGTALPVYSVYRTGEYVLDETGSIPYEDRVSLKQHAQLYSEMVGIDILYVRTDAQDLETYAQGLKIGNCHDQVMLIENETVQKVMFFGKAQLLSQEDARELLNAYTAEADCTLGIYYYVEAALVTIGKRRSEGVFDRVPDEYIEKLPRLQDKAALLKAAEQKSLQDRLDEISQRQGVDVLVYTVRNLDSKQPWDYAEDLYQNHIFGQSKHDGGILLLVCDGQWWMFTFGEARQIVNDSVQKYINARVDRSMKKEAYNQAFNRYADLCDEVITLFRTGEPYDASSLPKDPFPLKPVLLISVLAGLLAGSLAVRNQEKQLRSVRFHYDASDYLKNPEMTMTEDTEAYLYSTTEKRLKS